MQDSSEASVIIATILGKCVSTQDEVLVGDGSSKLDGGNGFGELDGITQVVVQRHKILRMLCVQCIIYIYLSSHHAAQVYNTFHTMNYRHQRTRKGHCKGRRTTWVETTIEIPYKEGGHQNPMTSGTRRSQDEIDSQ